MTPKERVIAALKLQQPDRIPWGEHSIDYNIYEMVLGRPSLTNAKFKEVQAYWQGRRNEVVQGAKRDVVDLVRALDMDLATVFQNVPVGYAPKPLAQLDEETYQDDEGSIYKVGSITGDLMKFPLNTAFIQRDIEYDEVCEMAQQARNAYENHTAAVDGSCFEVVRHAVAQLGDTHFIITPINGIEWPRFGATEEDSWVNLILEPEICGKIAELQFWQTMAMLEHIAGLGVDGVLSVGDLGNTNNLAASPQLYNDLILPWHKRIYQECHSRGLYVLRHCCGHVWPIINQLADTNDAYEGIQERAGMDIGKLKETVGDRLCLWGGILHEHIHGAGPQDIWDDARHAFGTAGKGGGFIMGSSHSLTVGATLENIMAMKEARDTLGGY